MFFCYNPKGKTSTTVSGHWQRTKCKKNRLYLVHPHSHRPQRSTKPNTHPNIHPQSPAVTPTHPPTERAHPSARSLPPPSNKQQIKTHPPTHPPTHQPTHTHTPTRTHIHPRPPFAPGRAMQLTTASGAQKKIRAAAKVETFMLL